MDGLVEDVLMHLERSESMHQATRRVTDAKVDFPIGVWVDKHELLREGWYISDMIPSEWIPKRMYVITLDYDYAGYDYDGLLPQGLPIGLDAQLTIKMYGRSEDTCRRYMSEYSDRIRRWLGVMFLHRSGLVSDMRTNHGVKRRCDVSRVTYHWLLLDVPRRFDARRKRVRDDVSRTIRARDVNGGYTYPCQKNGTIVVYRTEDAMKVFIHETVHLFGYDGDGKITIVTVEGERFEVMMAEVRSEFY
ncbi:MAG: hypothetical protein EB075_11300, partial [Bacteroidetes bacterium]|nr:hypothetical protein [Bacteroidota bacterium]